MKSIDNTQRVHPIQNKWHPNIDAAPPPLNSQQHWPSLQQQHQHQYQRPEKQRNTLRASPFPSRPGSRLLRALHQPLPRHVHRVPRGQRQPQRADPVRPSSCSLFLPNPSLHRLKQGRHLLVERAASFVQLRQAGRCRSASNSVSPDKPKLEGEVVFRVFYQVSVYRGAPQAVNRPRQLVSVEVRVERVREAGGDVHDTWELGVRLSMSMSASMPMSMSMSASTSMSQSIKSVRQQARGRAGGKATQRRR